MAVGNAIDALLGSVVDDLSLWMATCSTRATGRTQGNVADSHRELDRSRVEEARAAFLGAVEDAYLEVGAPVTAAARTA